MSTLTVSLPIQGPHELAFKTPFLAAAGTYGFGAEYGRLLERNRLGGIVTGSVTARSESGSRPPRVVETPGGLISWTGWPNPGARRVRETWASQWASWETPVIVSVAGQEIDDYLDVVEALEEATGAAGYEINLSYGRRAAAWADEQDIWRLVSHVRSATLLPLIVKLPSLPERVERLAAAAAEGGADAVTVAAVAPGLAVHMEGRHPARGFLNGVLSSPALLPLAVHMVVRVAGAVDLPILGGGGVRTLSDALQLFMAGAQCVQIGTATLSEPETIPRLTAELEAWMREEGVGSLAEIVGAASR